MSKKLDKSWKEWILLNLSRGCDKSEIVQILIDHQFDSQSIIDELMLHPGATNTIAILNQKTQTSEASRTFKHLIQQSEIARSIDSVVLPNANKVATDKANIFIIENFLDLDECKELIQLIRSHCRKSEITNPDEPDKAFRTSQTCDLGLLENHLLVQEIERRISEYMGFETDRAETLQGQYYQVGQQFKTHTDYFEPNTSEYEKFAGDYGQRTWTFMIYLNEVESGGETNFPALGLEVKPAVGKAVVWNSLLATGDVNPDTAHSARPVVVGEKFVITKWFRTYGKLQHGYEIPARKKLPIFTRDGFNKLSIPKDLYLELQKFYHAHKPYEMNEQSDAIGTYIKSESSLYPSRMVELSDEMRSMILRYLTPLLEEWVGLPLEASAVYGIREYQTGATLDMHADRIETHQISAILNIAQLVNVDWPLEIRDHMGRLHHILMKPGEMIFYESARLLHGRTQPLNGDFYANIFTHTKPL